MAETKTVLNVFVSSKGGQMGVVVIVFNRLWANLCLQVKLESLQQPLPTSIFLHHSVLGSPVQVV